MVRQLEPGDPPAGVTDEQADLGPLIGRQIGLYRLDRLLFIAAGAAFYATQHPVSGEPRTARVEPVAPGMLEERRSEIESAAAFSAPSVPAIYHVDVLDELLVVVTDAFDARPASELPWEGDLSSEQTAVAVSSMAAAIDAAHASGFVHGRMWLRPDLTPIMFDFVPAGGPPVPGHGRAFSGDRLDWVQATGVVRANRQAADIAALETMATWLATGGPTQRSPMNGESWRQRPAPYLAAAFDRQFASAGALASAFAEALSQEHRGGAATFDGRVDGAPVERTAHRADDMSASNGYPTISAWTPPQDDGGPATSPTMPWPDLASVPVLPRSAPEPAVPAPTEPSLPPARPVLKRRYAVLGGAGAAAVLALGLAVWTLRTAIEPPPPPVLPGPTLQSAPALVVGPTPAPPPTSEPTAQVASATQAALIAPTPSAAELAEQNAGRITQEIEAQIQAGSDRHPDPNQAVLTLDALRRDLAPASTWHSRVNELQARIMIEDGTRRAADSLVLKDRRVLNEAGERLARAGTLRPGDERIASGLDRVQLAGWWLDFLGAYAEHDSDRQIDALQKIVAKDPEFRTEEGSAKEKLFAALVGKAEQAWSAGQPDAARALLDQAEQLDFASTAAADRRALWFPTPTPVPATATPRPIPAPVQKPAVAPPVQVAPPPPPPPPPTQPPVRPAAPPTARPAPPPPPPTARPAPPPPTPRPAPPPTQPPPPPQQPPSNQLIPIGPSYVPPEEPNRRPTPTRKQ